jgi:hypothetical protein
MIKRNTTTPIDYTGGDNNRISHLPRLAGRWSITFRGDIPSNFTGNARPYIDIFYKAEMGD